MSRVLSQEEVKALLREPEAGVDAPPAEAPAQVAAYDFRDGAAMPRNRLRYVQFLHDRFAQHLAVSLSAYTRIATAVRLERIEQLSARRFLEALADPTAVFVTEPLETGPVIVVVDNELAFAFVDRLLGGKGEKATVERALTEIELSVLAGLVELLLKALEQSWGGVLEVTLAVSKTETRPALLTLDSVEESPVVLDLVTTLGSGRAAATGTLRVAVPLEIAEKLSKEQSRDTIVKRPPTLGGAPDTRAVVGLLLAIDVPVSVELSAKGVTAGDLMKLKPGHVLSLGRAVEEPAAVRVGGAEKFGGTLALSRGRTAVEVTAVHENRLKE